MASAGTVTVDFAAETAKFTAELKKVRKDLSGVRKDTDTMASSVRSAVGIFKGFIGVSAALAAVRSVIRATSEQEAAQAQLNSALAAAKAPVAAASAEFQRYASELQRTTTFGDEAIIGVESILLSFKGLSGGVIKDATKSVLDLSARMGIDAPSAAKLLGKALADPIGGLGSLSRSGVIFTDQQKEQIKTLVESGDRLKAQALILDSLKSSFGGAAEAARNTFGGALASLKNNFGDLLEGSTGINAAADAINNLSDIISSPEIKNAFQTLIAGLAKTISLLAQTASGLTILLSGSGGNQSVDMDLQIEKLQKEREALIREMNAGGSLEDATGPIPSLYSKDSFEADQKRVAALDEQISQLITKKEQLNGFGDFGPGGALADVQVKAKRIHPKGGGPLDFVTGGEGTDNGAAKKAAEDAANARALEAANLLASQGKLLDDLEKQALDSGNDLADLGLKQSMAIIEDNFRALEDDAAERIKLEQETQQSILDLRAGAVDAAVGFLQVLAGKSKTAARVLILVNRGLAIAQAVQNTAVAVTKALAIYGPTPAGFAAAASAKTLGALEVGLIAATGVAEVASVGGGGSSPVGPGTPNNPVYTRSDEGAQRGASAQSAVQIIFNGPTYGLDDFNDRVGKAVKDLVNGRDVVIISQNSRQAKELRG